MSESRNDIEAPTQSERDALTNTYLVTLKPDVDMKHHLDWMQTQARQPSSHLSECQVVNQFDLIKGYQAKLSTSAYEDLARCNQVKSIVKEQFAELDDD